MICLDNDAPKLSEFFSLVYADDGPILEMCNLVSPLVLGFSFTYAPTKIVCESACISVGCSKSLPMHTV